MTIRQFILVLLSAAAIAFASSAHALLPQSQVAIDQAPSSVAIVIIKSLSKCTAVKIAPKVFLTAAHCFIGFDPSSDISIEQISKGRQVLQVRTQITKLEVHPGYNNPSKFHTVLRTIIGDLPDLAMFKTKDDVDTPSANVNLNGVREGQNIWIGGFGDQGKDLCHPILHPCSLNMAVQKVSRVRGEFFATQPTRAIPYFLTSGDSGGPVYVRNSQTKQLEVVGINSMMAPSNPKQLANMIFDSGPPQTATLYMNLGAHSAWYVNVFRELTRDPNAFKIDPINPDDLKMLDDAPGVHDKMVFGD